MWPEKMSWPLKGYSRELQKLECELQPHQVAIPLQQIICLVLSHLKTLILWPLICKNYHSSFSWTITLERIHTLPRQGDNAGINDGRWTSDRHTVLWTLNSTVREAAHPPYGTAPDRSFRLVLGCTNLSWLHPFLHPYVSLAYGDHLEFFCSW